MINVRQIARLDKGIRNRVIGPPIVEISINHDLLSHLNTILLSAIADIQKSPTGQYWNSFVGFESHELDWRNVKTRPAFEQPPTQGDL